MAKEPESRVLRIPRQIQATLAEQGRKLDAHTHRFDQLNVQLRDIQESTVTALGLSAHANVRQENVQTQIEELRERVARLEEKV